MNKSTRKEHPTCFALHVQLSLFIYQLNEKLERTRIKNSRLRGKKGRGSDKGNKYSTFVKCKHTNLLVGVYLSRPKVD